MDRPAGRHRVMPASLPGWRRVALPAYDHAMNTDTPARTWFVSRHPGAVAWAQSRRLPIDHWVAHLDPAVLARGDTVIGSLPVHLAAAVCACGARYLHLALNLPEDWRGRELSAGELDAAGGRVQEFHIEPRETTPHE